MHTGAGPAPGWTEVNADKLGTRLPPGESMPINVAGPIGAQAVTGYDK